MDRFPHEGSRLGTKKNVFSRAKLHILMTAMTVMTLHVYDEGSWAVDAAHVYVEQKY